MEIDGASIGPTSAPYFIAEAGVNHNGELTTAKELIDVAVRSGADAVKFQTFSANRLVTRSAPKAEYQVDSTGVGSQYEMLKRYELDREAHETLVDYCTQNGITFLSTPFDRESADMLVDLGVSAIKLGSGELDNHPLLEHVAGFGLPMIVSTGMGTMAEVYEAHDVIRSVDRDADVVFLHCTSAYPCPIDDVNLLAMQTMAAELDVPVGYSDHTTLPEMPAFAVAAGSCVVEKHFTLDSTLPGPDHDTSLEPDELERAVGLVDTAYQARGHPKKRPVDRETKNRKTIRKGLHAAVDVPTDTRIEPDHVDIVRPAEGLSPRQYGSILGARTTRPLARGEPIEADDVDAAIEEDDH